MNRIYSMIVSVQRNLFNQILTSGNTLDGHTVCNFGSVMAKSDVSYRSESKSVQIMSKKSTVINHSRFNTPSWLGRTKECHVEEFQNTKEVRGPLSKKGLGRKNF